MLLKAKDSYRLDEEGGIFVVIVLDTSHCPICQSVLSMRATRQRVWWKGEEDKEILLIRRLYCDKCERIHHELPDCLVPYKRYGADIIENIANGQAAEDAPCPEGAVRRLREWWAAVKLYFLHILLTLTEKFGVSFGSPPAFRETVRAVANSKRIPCLRLS